MLRSHHLWNSRGREEAAWYLLVPVFSRQCWSNRNMSHLPIILLNCHGNLPTSWHDSHGGKWSKTFCITLGFRKLQRQMEGGAQCLLGYAAGAVPHEISWWGRWPVLTSLHPAEGTKSSSAVPAVSLTAGYVAAADLPELLVPSASPAAGLVSVGLVSTLR